MRDIDPHDRERDKPGRPHAADDLVSLLRTLDDNASLERFLVGLHTPIFRYLRARLPHADQQAVRDLTIDTLVRVVLFRESCQATENGQVVGWALRIAERFRADYFRGVYAERSAPC